MPVAVGVQTRTINILPYNPKAKGLIAIYYQSKLTEEGKKKLKAYDIYNKYHLTMEQVGEIMEVNKSTISRWIRDVKKAKRIRRYQILDPKSKVPKHRVRRKRLTEEDKKDILEIRRMYRCGKDKISEYLRRDYKKQISASTIHRYIRNLRASEDPLLIYRNSKVKRKKRKRKRLIRVKDIEGRLERRVFERFQIDTKYYVINSKTFYIVTAIDVVTRMVFAYGYSRHTARCARDFLRKLNYLFDIKDSKAYIQRDNGSEFMGEFEEEAERFNITVITNYVRKPEMNGFIERFNGTLKRELLEYEMPSNVGELNEILKDYIIHYNFDRIHQGIGNITPFEKYAELVLKKDILSLKNSTSNLLHMLWTSTLFCILFISYI